MPRLQSGLKESRAGHQPELALPSLDHCGHGEIAQPFEQCWLPAQASVRSILDEFAIRREFESQEQHRISKRTGTVTE